MPNHQFRGEGRDMEKLCAAALWWQRRGFPIFPLKPRGKVPLGSLAPHGLKDATLDPSIIKTWWHLAPAANIGFALPADIFVIDLDGEDACNGWLNTCGRHGELPPTLTVNTKRGKHLYFRCNIESRNSVGQIGKGVDVRGNGGYVLLPPSVHPSGALYTLDCRTELEIARAPEWLTTLALIDNEPTVAEIIAPLPPHGHNIKCLRAVEGIIRFVASARIGERNAATFWGACRLREYVVNGVIDRSLANELLMDAARRTGLLPREISATVASAFRGRQS
jgi:Bifunctional DNA primase/polymerase, N-terminal